MFPILLQLLYYTSRKPVRCTENKLKLNLKKIIGVTMIFIVFYILSKYEN